MINELIKSETKTRKPQLVLLGLKQIHLMLLDKKKTKSPFKC